MYHFFLLFYTNYKFFNTDQRVLVIGGGNVGLSRVNHLLEADAKVTVVSKELCPELEKYEALQLLECVEKREYKDSDLQMYETTKREQMMTLDLEDDENRKIIDDFEKNQKFALVLICINEHNIARHIYFKCKQLGLVVNLADDPQHCDFYFGSVYRRGALQIMISTNGKSPRLCNRIKNFKIKPMFESLDIANAIDNLGYMRSTLRSKVDPGEDRKTVKERMHWNRQITDFFSIEDWCEMDHDKIDAILSKFPELPTPE